MEEVSLRFLSVRGPSGFAKPAKTLEVLINVPRGFAAGVAPPVEAADL